MPYMPLLWFILLVALLAVEALTLGLIGIWFALGSLLALIVSLLGGPLWLQITLFIAASAASLALTRPFVRNVIRARAVPTNADRNIGQSGLCVESIDNKSGAGTVRLGGKIWTARSADGAAIPAGALVRVQSIEGVKLMVSLEKEPALNK